VKKQKLKEYNDLEVFHSYCEQHVQTGISIAILAAVAIIGESKIIEHYPEEVTSYSFKYEQYVNDIHKKMGNKYSEFHAYLKKRLVYDVCMGINGKGVLKGYNKLHKKYAKYIDDDLLREIEAGLRIAMLNSISTIKQIKKTGLI
jgi:hypothetical protein